MVIYLGDDYKCKEINRRVLRGILDLILLKIIMNKGESYGYELMNILRKEYGVSYRNETIYKLVLKKLEYRYLLKSQWCLVNNKPRKVFEITSKGKEYLEDNKREMNIVMKKFLGA